MHQVNPASGDTVEGLLARIERLSAVGAALSSERNLDRLLEKILVAAMELTGADGGTLYRVREDGQALRFAIMHNDTLAIALGGTSGQPIDFPDLPLVKEDGAPNDTLVAAWAVIHDCTINIADAYSAAGFDFSGTRRFDERTGYRSQSFLTVPMKNHENEIIGVLQLINARDAHCGAVRPFSAADQRIAESLASEAAIALTNRLLIARLEELFESFINLINMAIDEKSPYTGGHCQRVPVLTMMIAEAVHATTEGPLAGFCMSDADRYELRIAGMLHDCGKITTPVHVVDKATKLHTLFDRIHLIDIRFEVVRRDAEIRMWRAIAGGLPEEMAREQYAVDISGLNDDRDFLRHANIGSEAMTPADQERVRAIARRWRWQNENGIETDFLTENEVENLTIRAGTLTADEREVINHHIVATIRMLEALPWPKHLKRVPEFAGGHHERIDGKGYPRGLTGEQMSLQARMIAIADIFEALTARDRPYKRGMKLSQAMGILANFARNGHIDPQLFEVFVRQKVYLRYAEQFLDPAQIDDVDAGALLSCG